MVPKKQPRENVSKYGLCIERDHLVKIKHTIGRCKSKEDTVLLYRVNAFFEKYYNKWWTSLTPRKKLNVSVDCGCYKVLVQMVEEPKESSYKEVCCINGPDGFDLLCCRCIINNRSRAPAWRQPPWMKDN